jgi:hypothetical protein
VRIWTRYDEWQRRLSLVGKIVLLPKQATAVKKTKHFRHSRSDCILAHPNVRRDERRCEGYRQAIYVAIVQRSAFFSSNSTHYYSHLEVGGTK